jgi:hypothetical protein
MNIFRPLAVREFIKHDSESLEKFCLYSGMVLKFAKTALPYCHARLAPMQPDYDIEDIKIEDLTDDQIEALIARLEATNKDDLVH